MDSPSVGGATLIQQFTHTLTTSDWESVTFTTTSVLPAEAANGLLLHLFYAKTDMGASEKFAIAQVQLEPGTVATPFEFRPYGTELALCQRYYEKSYNIDVAPGSVSFVGETWIYAATVSMAAPAISYKVTKRTSSPTLQVWGQNGVAGQARNAGNSTYINVGFTAGENNQDHFITWSSQANFTPGAVYGFQWAASAEL
jgi:hypothetical protein